MRKIQIFENIKNKLLQRNNNNTLGNNINDEKVSKILVSLFTFNSITKLKDIPSNKYFIIDKFYLKERSTCFDTDKRIFIFIKDDAGNIICRGSIFTKEVVYNVIGQDTSDTVDAIIHYDDHDNNLTIQEIAERYFTYEYLFNVLNSIAYRMIETNIIYKDYHIDNGYIRPQVYPYYPLSLNQFIRSICEYTEK